MIQVTVYKDNQGHYTGFRCDGHADYAQEGQDIVCSAVSVLTINTINAIDALTDDAYSLGDDETAGLIDFKFYEDPTHDATLLIDAMVLGMRSIEEQYGEFIHFDIEEV